MGRACFIASEYCDFARVDKGHRAKGWLGWVANRATYGENAGKAASREARTGDEP
jgi:hypothetical protein